MFEALWGKPLERGAGAAHPQHARCRRRGQRSRPSTSRARTSCSPTPTRTHVAAGLAAMECVVVHDLFLNETANYAHVFLPGSTFLEKDGTFTNAERRIQRVRKVMTPRNGGYADWEITQLHRQRASVSTGPTPTRAEIMDEIAELTPTFAGVSFAKLDELGSVQWPCNDANPVGSPVMHIDELRSRQGQVRADRIRSDRRAHRPALPAAADHRAYPHAVQRRRADAADRERGLARGGPPGDPPARCRAARHQGRRLGAHCAAAPARRPCARSSRTA